MTSFYSLASQGVPVYAWLRDSGFYFPKNKDFEASFGTNLRPSHNLYNNGVCYVPPQFYSTFLEKYAQSIGQGLFFSENRTPIFRMFFDVDLKVDLPLKEDTLAAIVNSLHQSVSDIFKEANSKAKGSMARMVVAAVPGRKVDAGKRMKYGMHLTFPDIYVTPTLAVEARNIAIAHLVQNEGLQIRQLEGVQWYDVVDHRVYVSAGCRMIFSEKMEYCKACKREDGSFSVDCTSCFGDGKVRMSKSVYEISKAYSAPGIIDKKYTADLKSNPLQALKDTSIRTDEQAPNVPNADPKLVQSCSTIVKDKYGPVAWHVIGQKSSGNELGQSGSTASEHLGETDERVTCIIKLIRQLFPEIVSKRASGKQFMSPKCIADDAGQPISYTIIDSSKACLNLERTSGAVKQHNSVNTYFVISPKGVYQRCFCQCQTQSGRIDGPCSSYRSTPRRMYPADKGEDLFDPSSSVIRTLFPHTSKSSGKDTWSDVLCPAPNGTFPVVNQVAFPKSNILPAIKNMSKGIKRSSDGEIKPRKPKMVPYEAFDNDAEFVALRRITDMLDLIQRRGPFTAYAERELALHPPKTKKRSNQSDNE